MNMQCKALTGLLAAGIAVAVGPAGAANASVAARPKPTTFSTAGLFGPVKQTVALNIPTKPFPWPRRLYPTLSVSVAQGKGPEPTTPPACDSLLVTVTGSEFPSGLYSGELEFYNSSYQLVDYWYYTWNPQGSATQTLGTLAGSWLNPAGGATDLTVAVVQEPGVKASFVLDCAG